MNDSSILNSDSVLRHEGPEKPSRPGNMGEID